MTTVKLNIQPYLTTRNLLITTALIGIYVLLLRWWEIHCDPPGTIFTVVPPFCPESIATPLVFFPLMEMLVLGGVAYSLFIGGRGLVRWTSRIIRRGGK